MKHWIGILLFMVVLLPGYSQKTGKSIPPEILNTVVYSPTQDTMRLAQLLEKETGKVVLIDFWASVCAPCIEEFPFSAQLQKKYSGAAVAFLFLSADNVAENWQAALQKYHLTQNQYRIEPSSKPAIAQYFKINGIPHYILLHPDHTVASPDAPPPSNPRLSKSIDQLLKIK